MRRVLLLAVLMLACQSESAPPEKVMHLERWDGAGVPVVGDIDVTMRGLEPASDLATATGTIEVVCDPCVIEDSRIPVPAGRRGVPAHWQGQSLGIPRIDLGMVRGQLSVSGGRGQIEGRAAGGPVLEIAMSGTIALAPTIADSQTDIQLVVRPGPELEAADSRLENMLLLLGPADASGAISIRLSGPLGRLRPVSRR